MRERRISWIAATVNCAVRQITSQFSRSLKVRPRCQLSKLEDVSDPHLSQNFACVSCGVGVPCVSAFSTSSSVSVK